MSTPIFGVFIVDYASDFERTSVFIYSMLLPLQHLIKANGSIKLLPTECTLSSFLLFLHSCQFFFLSLSLPEDPKASATARHVGLHVAVIRLVGREDLLQILVRSGPWKVAHENWNGHNRDNGSSNSALC